MISAGTFFRFHWPREKERAGRWTHLSPLICLSFLPWRGIDWMQQWQMRLWLQRQSRCFSSGRKKQLPSANDATQALGEPQCFISNFCLNTLGTRPPALLDRYANCTTINNDTNKRKMDSAAYQNPTITISQNLTM